ncbi:hypothetical protein BH18CHL2_BH18CHL2_00340 [soil metagenome]
MTLLRIGLRQQLVGLTAVTAIGVLGGILNALAFIQIAGPSPADRLAFAQQMELLGAQLSYMLPRPTRLDTLGGFLEWRHFGSMQLVYGVWAVLASAGIGRGAEERGFVEQWLAAGVRRTRYLLSRAVVFTAAAAVAIAAMLLAIWLVPAGREPLSGSGLAATGLGLVMATLCCFGIGLAIAQVVTTRRAAAGTSAGLLVALFLINGAGRSADVGPVRWLSPFYLLERSKPLTVDAGLDALGSTLLSGGALLLITVAAVAFARRDLGGSALPLRPAGGATTRSPSPDPLLRAPILAPLRQQRVWVASWVADLGALAALLMSITRSIVDSLAASPIPLLRAYFERAGLGAYDSFVGVVWLSTALLLLSIFAITQVAGWSSDDAEGRLATILATPVSRGRVVVERLATMLVGAALIAAASSIAVYAGAAGQSIRLDGGRLAVATTLLLTVPFAFGGVGQLVAVWRPRLAVVALSAVAVLSYYVQSLAPLFDLPDWVKNLSLYSLYGTPLSGDVGWGGILALVAIGAGANGAALLAVRRRDVGA